MLLYDNAKRIFDGEKNYTLERAAHIEALTPMQRFSVNGKADSTMSREEEIAKFKKNVTSLVNNKDDHTQRGVSDIAALFELFPGLSEDFVDLAKGVEELHDLGRHPQALETGTHVDADSYNTQVHEKRGFSYDIAQRGISDHGRHGAYLLKEGGLFAQSNIPDDYWKVIYNVVKYHVNAKGMPFHIERLDDNVFNGSSLRRVANNPSLRNKFMTLYYETVKAVDDFDLHNKVLNGEIPILGRKTFGLDVFEGDTVQKVADRWGITEEQLREINGLVQGNDLMPGDIVRIDPILVPAEKFQIAEDYAFMYYTDTLGTNLPALQSRPDYTFLHAQIFRWSTLRNISIKAVLQHILDRKMFDATLDLYPEKYRLIMKPFSDYAKQETVDRIEKSPSKIYALRTVDIRRN